MALITAAELSQVPLLQLLQDGGIQRRVLIYQGDFLC